MPVDATDVTKRCMTCRHFAMTGKDVTRAARAAAQKRGARPEQLRGRCARDGSVVSGGYVCPSYTRKPATS